jgi:hypothetical protein
MGFVVGIVVVVGPLAVVVGVTTGGAAAIPSALGGGLVGAIKDEPKMLTNIFWAVG